MFPLHLILHLVRHTVRQCLHYIALIRVTYSYCHLVANDVLFIGCIYLFVSSSSEIMHMINNVHFPFTLISGFHKNNNCFVQQRWYHLQHNVSTFPCMDWTQRNATVLTYIWTLCVFPYFDWHHKLHFFVVWCHHIMLYYQKYPKIGLGIYHTKACMQSEHALESWYTLVMCVSYMPGHFVLWCFITTLGIVSLVKKETSLTEYTSEIPAFDLVYD